VTADNTEQRDLDMSGITAVEAASFNGDVTVEAGAERARLEVALRGKATFEVTRIGSLLYVWAKKRGLTYAGSGASLSLWVPAGLALKLATVNGMLRVHGAARSLAASVAGGAIEARDLGRCDVKASSSSGRIEVHGVSGRVSAATANGAVTVAHVTGPVDLSSASGALEIENAEGQIKASTANGPVRTIQTTGQLQIATGGGEIHIAGATLVPGSTNWIKTGSGPIEVMGMHAPGGLRIHARAHAGRIAHTLPGYEVKTGRDRLMAQLRGTRPATLELASPGEIRISV
jgi:DUF4097 and DUF4098 domain-containing protein YvlB